MSEGQFWVLIFILIVMIVVNTYAAVQHQQYMQQVRADVQQVQADMQTNDERMRKGISAWLKPIDADVQWLRKTAHLTSLSYGYGETPPAASNPHDGFLVTGHPGESQPTNPMHSHVSRTDPMPVAVAPGPPSSRANRSDSGGLMTQLPAMRRPAA